jgi:hypothetical protein
MLQDFNCRYPTSRQRFPDSRKSATAFPKNASFLIRRLIQEIHRIAIKLVQRSLGRSVQQASPSQT